MPTPCIRFVVMFGEASGWWGGGGTGGVGGAVEGLVMVMEKSGIREEEHQVCWA